MRRVRFIIVAFLAVLWVAPLGAQQATGTIRGRVSDGATKQPLAGATVTVGSRGALSQADGRYVVTGVPVGTDSLRARILGYTPAGRSVTVAGGDTLTVDLTLTAQAVGLSELVVVGYGRQTAGNITGAVKQINADEFNTGQIVRPEDLISSKVAGVQVSDNNEPGGGIAIRIRGATSVSASSDPLYVIDGVPLGTGAGGGLSAGRDPLNFLNPNDIESITVLKDASAAAIYGTNAANGVVLITTKSASGGNRRTSVDYSSSMSSASVTRMPQVLTAAQFQAAVAQYAPGRVSTLGGANTDWLSLITHSAIGQEHNVALSSASASSFYRLSLGYLKQDGILQGTTAERVSLGANYDQRLLDDNLAVRLSLKGSRTNDQFTPSDVLGNAVSMAPTQPVVDPTSPTGYWDWNTSGASASNPLASLNLSSDHGTTWRSIGSVQGEYQFPFLQGLRAHVNLSYDFTEADRQRFFPGNLASQMRQGHGYLSLANNNQLNSLLETYVNYAPPINVGPGSIDLTGGYSYGKSHSEYPFFQESNLNSNLLGDNGIPTAGTVQNLKSVVDSKLISFFGRLNYNISDRYLAAVSVRHDGSSRFGPNHAWGTFPSVSLGWRLSGESFMRGVTKLSDLKLRASWAKTGNQAFTDYLQYPTYTYSDAQTQYQFGTQFVTTIRPSAVDPNIKWEQTGSYDVGLDFGLVGQRLVGALDWYTKKTTDLIFTVPPAAGTNFSNFITTNIGSMKNRGVELSLSARVLEGHGDGLGYTATIVAGHNTNELLSIDPNRAVPRILTGGVSGGVGTTIQELEPGQPIYSFFVCKQAYQGGKPIEGKYLDLATDTVVTGCNNNERRAYHDPAPKWILGHSSYVTYHRFDLSFTLRAYLGSYTYNNVASSTGAYNALTGGGSPSNMSASVLKTNFVVPQFLSDYYVEKASFLRMDNITIGYALTYRGQPVRLFATVQNAFTITGYSGVDPTAGLNGLDNNIYPRSRIFTGGLSVQL
jgi:iron complex outermembrane receptor protein